MNIFFLDKTPEKSAQYLCDKHIPKMVLESAQMLSTAVQKYTGELDYLYKSAYPNHPMTKWVGFNQANFNWSLKNANFISQEYCKRFDKIHKSSNILLNIYYNNHKFNIPEGNFTEPPQCMPDEYRDTDYVTAYRRYYNNDKKYFAKWEKGRSCPKWWVH
jgi:hypothetical protein